MEQTRNAIKIAHSPRLNKVEDTTCVLKARVQAIEEGKVPVALASSGSVGGSATGTSPSSKSRVSDNGPWSAANVE